MASTVIPFGPQHPVLPEPLHLKLVVEDEIVKDALPAIGYVHRGLEKLADIRDYNQMIGIVERVCGICSAIHALCYCQGLEEMMGIQAPDRARYLRVVWTELERVTSHMLWLGLFADAFGFESLFMQCWKIRERVMDIMEATCGNRVIMSVSIVGGVRKDISPDQVRWVMAELDDVVKQVKELEKTFIHDYGVKQRTCGIGVLTKEKAYELGAVGPVLRGSGWAQDSRLLRYAAFNELDYTPVTHNDGDCYARLYVRYFETLQSLDLARQALSRLPAGDLATPVKGKPEGEVVTRVEQPRGELFYYIKGNGSKFLDRCRIRTPTFANVPPLVAMLPGIELADVPVVALTIDPCISCTER